MSPHGWDRETDIIAVGYGAAGAAVALSAADSGAQTLIVEKQPPATHTPSTRLSGGQIMAVNDADAAMRYLDRCAEGLTPHDVNRAWANRATDIVEWVRDHTGLGLTQLVMPEHPDFDGSGALASYGDPTIYRAEVPDPPAIAGRDMFAAFERAVTRQPRITVTYEARAERLVQDPTGRVVGVEVTQGGERVRFRARAAVVLTCGGFEFDEQLKRDHLRGFPANFYAAPSNTGDGVRMAQAVGADLWHMSLMVGHAVPRCKRDGLELTFNVRPFPGACAFLDRNGRRFINEYMHYRHDFHFELVHYDTLANEFPRLPFYWIFDAGRLGGKPLANPGSMPDSGPHRYTWSEDWEREVGLGWITKADTLAELVAAIGVRDPDLALHDLLAYNQACAEGRDPLGRPEATLIALNHPPFYCMEMCPGGANTSGGPRRNGHAQILDPFGEPIAGLYAAGELGQVVGTLYPCAGAGLSDALCFGRIAAEHALAAGASAAPVAASRS